MHQHRIQMLLSSLLGEYTWNGCATALLTLSARHCRLSLLCAWKSRHLSALKWWCLLHHDAETCHNRHTTMALWETVLYQLCCSLYLFIRQRKKKWWRFCIYRFIPSLVMPPTTLSLLAAHSTWVATIALAVYIDSRLSCNGKGCERIRKGYLRFYLLC